MQRFAWPLRLLSVILAGALLFAGVAIGVAPRVWHILNAHEELPVELPDFQPLSQRSLVLDVAGNVIAIFERENSQPITLAQVPEDVVSALLAVEDNEYWLHQGVNVRGFFRALLSNFASDAPIQGASTITQQVVKNEFLAGLPRDGRYKLLQAHYATMLEKKLSKEAILERYLNTVYFGNNAYGLQAAAEVYFGKSAAQLTLVEGAFLAGLVRSPSGYDPILHLEQSQRRFVQVVERLIDTELVTPAEGERLETTWQLPDRLQVVPDLSAGSKPSYFSNALRAYLLTGSTILGATEQERANLLYRGGLRIHTTLDAAMQAKAEAARNILPANSVGFDAAVVSLDTATGAVRAMVGGRGLRSGERGGEINMALVPRQTGSSIKAFILAAAYQAGAQTDDVINGNAPCTVPDYVDGVLTEKTVESGYGEIGPLDGANTWSSSDCGFVRLSYAVGLHRVVDTVYRMAHSAYFYQGQSPREHEPFQPLPLTATGNNALSAMDMATGMQSITNLGVHHDPYYVEYIEGADGGRLFTHNDVGTRALDENAALKTVQSMKGVIRVGTGARNLQNFSRPAMGKTGTQYENTNAWFVGGTPQLTTAVWVGDPNGYTEMNNIPEFEAEMGRNGKVQGADYPARIWGAYMEAAHDGLPVLDWSPSPVGTRLPMRIFVPGDECPAILVAGTLPEVSIVGISTTTSTTTTTTTIPTESTGPDTSTTVAPPTTVSNTAIVMVNTSVTAVPPDQRDPRAPLPSIDPSTYFFSCATPDPRLVIQTETT